MYSKQVAADEKSVRRGGATAVARRDLYPTRRRACYSMLLIMILTDFIITVGSVK